MKLLQRGQHAVAAAVWLASTAPLLLPEYGFVRAAQLRQSDSSAIPSFLQLRKNAEPKAVPEDPLEGCFEVGQSICLEGRAGKNFIISPTAALPELVLWYSFDKSLPVDESGGRHHLEDSQKTLRPLTSGPGILGRGASAVFDGHSYRTVRSSPALESSEFTVALWVYLLEDSIGGWRTIFSKCSDVSPAGLLPALLLNPDERRLHARVSEQALNSVGLLPLRRWTHIALASTGSVLQLYINGLLDGQVIIGGGPVRGGNSGSLHIGGDPYRSGTKALIIDYGGGVSEILHQQMALEAYMDDFRWYNHVLSAGEVRALTFPSLTGVGTDFVHLGCASCSYTDAVGHCQGGAHLCSLQELYSGGFHTARVMGWLAQTPEVWYSNEQGVDQFSGKRKLGLCCTGP